MVEDSLITEEMRSKIGVESEPEVYEIERGRIQRFVQAIDDPNPLWQDEEYAKKSKYGGIIAPPTIIPTIGWEQFSSQEASLLPESRLHGGTELEYYQPVRPGDKITITTKVIDMRERQGKRMGRMLLVTFERIYKNQRGELVAKCRQMIIGYKTERAKYG